MNNKKELNTKPDLDKLGLGEYKEKSSVSNLSKVIVLLALLVVTAFLGSILAGRNEIQRLQLLEEENELLRAKVEQYSTTVDSIYNMLDSLGLTKKDQRDYPYYSGGAADFVGYSRDPELKLEMESTEEKLYQILSFVEPKFASPLIPQLDEEDFLGDIPSIYPTFGRLSDSWGSRIHPITKNLEFHHGIDISNIRGTPIYATAAGTVSKTIYTRGYGRHIVIDHGNGYKTLYAHLQSFDIKKGDKVTKGQIIGKMGSTGLSTGPHLHYEVIYNSRKLNPANFLNRVEEYAKK
jgi:murein DD-endopeptidase MepM/ murein hydrolase activator NlpD